MRCPMTSNTPSWSTLKGNLVPEKDDGLRWRIGATDLKLLMVLAFGLIVW